MQQAIQQTPLAQRIPALAEMVQSARAQKENAAKAEAEYLDLLAQAEAEIGNQAIERSGLIEENPYQATGVDPAPPVEGGTDTQALPDDAPIAKQDRAARSRR